MPLVYAANNLQQVALCTWLNVASKFNSQLHSGTCYFLNSVANMSIVSQNRSRCGVHGKGKLSGGRPLPKRGQVKEAIAASVINKISNVLSIRRLSSHSRKENVYLLSKS
eukprot:Gb_41147 [translate_table: standard]